MMQKIGEMLGHKEAEASPAILYRCPNCQSERFHGPIDYGRLVKRMSAASDPFDYPPYIEKGSGGDVFHCEGCGQWLSVDDLKPGPWLPPK